MNDIIAGADGCRGGWVVVREGLANAGLSWEVVSSLPRLFNSPQAPTLLAVDIPIGLTLVGPRECDLAARKLLGPGRASSVFTAPIRPVLAATSYDEASRVWYEAEEKRATKQTWAILPKIREVDAFLRDTPRYQEFVREIHPEVCFYFLAGGRPMRVRKDRADGRAERAEQLRRHFGSAVDSALGDRRSLGCQPDDILDAFAALWTARRVRAGTAVTIPASPPHDSLGLRMEMVA